ncbi:hypothetical protein [Streptomyces sp. NRRL S-241]|uniref:DUF7739 domain-containing protein n=1 Tax=Streptomyces sp. NRRL S-241 TaxID=1463896 RepID=UPI0004C0506D|nr:hypothetical protein [Streptomyces sp. NRRL S-241]
MTTCVITSHGGDFFGHDRHLTKSLTSLADYARGCLPADEREPLVKLLAAQQLTEVGTEQTIPAADAGQFAGQLRRIARHRYLRSTKLKPPPSWLTPPAAPPPTASPGPGAPKSPEPAPNNGEHA